MRPVQKIKTSSLFSISKKQAKEFFGPFGGKFVSELLLVALEELEQGYHYWKKQPEFKKELNHLLKTYAGRETPLYFAARLSKEWQARVYLKREDLLHTGAHKLNNTLGQVLLAKKMGKKRIIAETGAGQHGVATATACALLNLQCVIFMGEEDLRRQKPNVFRMELLGAQVVGVGGPQGTLRDAVNEALREWSRSLGQTHYCLGSVVGPYPFPRIVRDFQVVIGKEARRQILTQEGQLPQVVLACVGGGSNALGIFYAFLKDKNVELVGIEAGGRGHRLGEHASSLSKGKPGILHGSFSYIVQNPEGQVAPVHSISAGLDYPGVGPEHAYLKETGQATYASVKDKEALQAFQQLTRLEGIIPALESAHAVAYAKKWIQNYKKNHAQQNLNPPVVLINLSGRGDKDIEEVRRLLTNLGK